MIREVLCVSTQKHAEDLYKDFLNLEYPELEERVIKARDKSEREFYAQLCDFYLAQHQPRVMREKPF
jgi:hypothetical protein